LLVIFWVDCISLQLTDPPWGKGKKCLVNPRIKMRPLLDLFKINNLRLGNV
jgi:hypothetical protein